jgi:N-acetylglutamate synthase
MSSSSDLVRGVQERAARALPAEHLERVGGWWLRQAPRGPWWVGTVLPHGAGGPGDLAHRVTRAEGFYARHGAAAGFQVSPGAHPEGLDELLAERGYRRRGPMSLQVAPTARVRERARAGALRLRVDDRPTRAWLAVWDAVHGRGTDPRAERDLLDRVEQPSAYAAVLTGDGIVAVGRAVADAGWAGVFGMATRPEARGKGAAGGVLAALADWAGARHADRMYLQVELDNAPALRLYEQAGFRELCRYHYRIAR